MHTDLYSLNQIHPKRYYIPVSLFLAALLLIFGLYLPVITIKELIFWKTTFSIITGIQSLFLEGHYFLAAIILLFSVCFPILKLTTLFYIWFSPVSDTFRSKVIEWMGILGKWSMLDVFVVAIMIIITKISKFASAEARIGIYFFGTSVILAMTATEKIHRLLKPKRENSLEEI